MRRNSHSTVVSGFQHFRFPIVLPLPFTLTRHLSLSLFFFYFLISNFSFRHVPGRFSLMQITTMVGSHCDDTQTAFRTEPPLTKEILECAVTNFFPAGLGDMLS